MNKKFFAENFLVIGDLILDQTTMGEVNRVSPEAPIAVLHHKSDTFTPGGAGNTAHNLSFINVPTTLIGILGRDDNAKRYSQLCKKSRIHLAHLYDSEPTICKQRFVSDQQLLRVDKEVYRKKAHPHLLSIIKSNLSAHTMVVLSDYNKGTLHNIPEIIRFLQSKRIPILVDPKGEDFRKYKGASILTPNKKEFELVYGTSESYAAMITKAKKAIRNLKLDAMIITLGSEGVLLVTSKQHFHYQSFARDVYDVTGAGDTFISHLAYWLGKQCDIKDSVKYANRASGCAVSKRGVATVSIEEYMHQGKIVNQPNLKKLIKKLRAMGKTIAFTNGCFDIIHAGHISSFQEIKKNAQIVIVGVNSDTSVQRLKGKARPIHTLEHRLMVLAELQSIDYLVPFDFDTPISLIKTIKPDILSKGEDYKNQLFVGSEFVKRYGGKILYTPLIKNLSTTTIVNEKNKSLSKK